MMSPMPRQDYQRHDAERAAEQRLRSKYPESSGIADIVSTVGIHADYGPDPHPNWFASGPDPGHIIAALTLMDEVRRHVDSDELHLIAHARARGTGWPEIAAALGYDDTGSATRRYRQLRARWPGYRPPRQDAAPWAAAHHVELREAAQAVVCFRDEIAAEHLSLGIPLADLERAATVADDPEGLYWAAHAAACREHWRSDASPARAAIVALALLVTEPLEEAR